MERKPYVSGQFYPSDREKLKNELRRLCPPVVEKKDAICLIAPHAGYMYSGAVAGSLYASVNLKKIFIILCPNHSGMGEKCAVMSRGAWNIPLGSIPINEGLANAIKDATDLVAEDSAAHAFEHSLEVQLPFIFHLNDDFDFVPIALKNLSREECETLGETIASSIKNYGEDVMIVASTDMTHYESDEVARKKDRLAIDRILQLDPSGLYATVREHDISMCGYIPTTVAMFSAIKLGARSAKLIQYATSGDVSGDYHRVVGYAGIYLS